MSNVTKDDNDHQNPEPSYPAKAAGTGGDNGDDNDPTSYEEAYDDDSFWKKVAEFASRAGIEIIRHALILYFCLKDKGTPKWAKITIVGALGYFIALLDAIPDFIPVVGFSDDLGVLVLAIATVQMHIKPEHRQQAEEKLRTWFGDRGGHKSESPG